MAETTAPSQPHSPAGLPPVFVISLGGAEDRRALMTEKLAAAGLPFRFLDAVDGRKFDVNTQPIYNGRQRRLFFGRDLLGGEIGVLLSHKAAMQRLAALETDLQLPDEVTAPLRVAQTDRLKYVEYGGSESVSHQALVAQFDSVEVELLSAERDLVNELYRSGKLKDEPRRRIERDLDLREAQLANLRPGD